MREMLTLVVLLVGLFGAPSQAVGLNPNDCKIDTTGSDGSARTLTLKVTSPPNVPEIKFTIKGPVESQDLIVPLHAGRKTIVKITPTEASTSCEIVGAGVVIEATVSEVTSPIGIGEGETVEIVKFDYDMVLKMTRGNRNLVPISFNVEGGAEMRATFILKPDHPAINPEQPAINPEQPAVNLPSQKETLVMVPQTRILADQATFDVKMNVGAEDHVVITNAVGGKRTIKQNDKETNFVCLDQSCPFEIESKKDNMKQNVLLHIKFAANANLNDKLKLTLELTKKEMIQLEKGFLGIVRVKKDEFGDALSCSFSSEQHTPFTITSFVNTDRVRINDVEANYYGKPVTGTYQFEAFKSEKQVKKLELKLMEPFRAFIEFDIINAEAQTQEDTKKWVQMDKSTQSLYFFKGELQSTKPTDFEIRQKNDARIHMKIVQTASDFEEILAGHSDIIKKLDKLFLRRPLQQKDITLILETTPDSSKPTSTLTIGDNVVEVGQVSRYHYIRQKDFKSSKELLVKLEEDGVKVKYTRIEDIVPLPIRKGNHTYKQGGHFNLPVKEATTGVTLKVKPNIGEVELIVTLGREDADGKPIVLSKKVKTEGEIIYIYPSDINKASNLDVDLTLEEGGSVEINSILGIETIEIKKSGSYIFRKNTVRINIEKATEDYFMDVELDVDSPAKSVTFEMEKTNHEIDSPKTITLKKAFLEKKPVPICKFTSTSPDQEAHVHLTIRAASAQTESTQAPTPATTPAPVCNPACTGNMECKKGGEKNECVCLTGYTGQDCAISGSAGMKQSIAAVLVVSLLPYLLHY